MIHERLTTLQLIWRESKSVFHARNPFPPGGVVEVPETGGIVVTGAAVSIGARVGIRALFAIDAILAVVGAWANPRAIE